MCSSGRTFALFPGQTRKPSIRYHWLQRTWSWDRFGLDHGGQCKHTRNCPVPPLGNGAQFRCYSLIRKSSVRIFLHVPNAIMTSFESPLIDVGQHEWFLAHVPRSRCGRWKTCKGGGRLQRIALNFWNGNTTQRFDCLRQDSPKTACSISNVSAPVFPRRKQVNSHTLLHFLLHREMRRTLMKTLPKGLHRANVGRYRPTVLHTHLFGVATCPTLLPFHYVL